MKAYHNSKELKQEVLAELQKHYEADNFIKSTYSGDVKGCSVESLLKSGNYIEYEKRFGIPISLAKLKVCIFELLPAEKSKEWAILFMSSFEVGKDYSTVIWKFLRWLLTDYLLPKITQEGKIYDDVRKSLKDCSYCLGNPNAASAANSDDDDAYELFADKLIELIKSV